MKVSSKRVSGKVLAMWCSGSLRKNPDKSTGSASDNFHQFPIYIRTYSTIHFLRLQDLSNPQPFSPVRGSRLKFSRLFVLGSAAPANRNSRPRDRESKGRNQRWDETRVQLQAHLKQQHITLVWFGMMVMSSKRFSRVHMDGPSCGGNLAGFWSPFFEKDPLVFRFIHRASNDFRPDSSCLIIFGDMWLSLLQLFPRRKFFVQILIMLPRELCSFCERNWGAIIVCIIIAVRTAICKHVQKVHLNTHALVSKKRLAHPPFEGWSGECIINWSSHNFRSST